MSSRALAILIAVLAVAGIFLAARTETGRVILFLLVTGGGGS